MILKSVSIENYRCVKSATLEASHLTALVGANGSGKSALLNAVNLFYEGSSSIQESDFYNRNTDDPIRIVSCYEFTSDREREVFADYCKGDTLNVELHITWVQADGDASGKVTGLYRGQVYRHVPFQSVRDAGNAAQKLTAFRRLIDDDPARYPFNGKETAWGRAEAELTEWERQHKDECESSLDEGGFFRPPNVPGSPLAPFTQLVFVPAIREASDEAADSANATFGRLTRLIIGNITDSADVQALRERFRTEFAEIVKEHGDARLPELQARLAEALHGYAPHTEVDLQWVEGDVRLVPPKTRVWIKDDGFSGDIEGKGHGLQRLFVLSMLQVAANISPTGASGQPDFLLLIEEPELFQHPMQARIFQRILADLTETGSSSRRTQVALSTHSPLFIDLGQFDGIRRIEKVVSVSGAPAVTKIASVTLDNVVRKVESAFEESNYTVERFRTTLGTVLDSEVCEGFFSRAVVLVEGAEDQAILSTALRNYGFDPEANGMAIIPCGGKSNLDRPYAIFSALLIPTYVIFDGDEGCPRKDKDNHVRQNLALQRLVDVAEPKRFPETIIESKYAVFAKTLQAQITKEFGEETYAETFGEVSKEMGWTSSSKSRKNAMVLREVVARLHRKGEVSESLQKLVNLVTELS